MSIIIRIIKKLWHTKWRFYNPVYVLLFPISFLYFCCYKLRFCITTINKINDLSIICIGNITVGGGGKTPIALSIASYILNTYKRISIAFIATGYGGSEVSRDDVIKVDIAIHNAGQVGDEPLLLAAIAPTYVSKNRVMAAKIAKENGADLIIMDDGLQDISLYKDLAITVMDINFALGNEFLLPLGPLRTTMQWALDRTNIVILTNSSDTQSDAFHENIKDKNDKLEVAPIIDLKRKIWAKYLRDYNDKLQIINGYTYIKNVDKLRHIAKKNQRIYLLAGIAYPEKFIHSLKSINIAVDRVFIFRDHHKFTTKEIEKILTVVERANGIILTTTKDMTRLPRHYLYHFNVVEVEILVQWDKVVALTDILKKIKSK